MKKIFKKSISLLLAVSALCILFAFQASAISTTCQECGGSNIDYISLGNVGFDTPAYHHEVYCYDCGHSVNEEDCESCITDGNCTNNWNCVCGQEIFGTKYPSHHMQLSVVTSQLHVYTCSHFGCLETSSAYHTFITVNGSTYCSVCNYPFN